MLDDDTVTFFEGPTSLIIGFPLADGEPFAGHAWGLRVEPGTPTAVRLVLAERDACRRDDAVGLPVAVTAADVPTLGARQLKGFVRASGAPTPDELELAAQHRDAFFAEVQRTDGEPLELLHRLYPTSMWTWVIEVHELYDQTPGPGAGCALGGST